MFFKLSYCNHKFNKTLKQIFPRNGPGRIKIHSNLILSIIFSRFLWRKIRFLTEKSKQIKAIVAKVELQT